MDGRVLARRSLEKRLAPLRDMNLTPPPRGWLRAIREALGMTMEQLARRIGVAQPRIIALEKAEVEGSVSLRTLRDAAEAMGCTVVYAIVPQRPLNEMLRARAAQRAEQELARISHTMRLENQAVVAADLRAQLETMIEGFMKGSPSRLWDDA